MDERDRRVGLNEALFREVNDKVRGLGETFGAVTDAMTLVCECGDSACFEQLAMSPHDYEALRSDPLLFVLKPGHEAAGVEEVVERRDEYEIVRKRPGSPAVLAAATPPTQ